MAQKHYYYRPTVRIRRLSAELRRLREASGKTMEQVARELKEYTDGRWSKSKVARMESGQWAQPSPRDVRDMLDVYEVADAPVRDKLIELAREARERGWWTAYNDVWRGAFVGFEAEAVRIKTFEPSFVPGLLQTERYATAVYAADPPLALSAEDVPRNVEARMARRRIIEGGDPAKLWAIIDEDVLRRPVGDPEVMQEQIAHLIGMAERPNIALQVVRTAVGAHPGMSGAFVILEFADVEDAPLVYIETPTHGLFVEQPSDVGFYDERFDHLMARAEGPPETIEHMSGLLPRPVRGLLEPGT